MTEITTESVFGQEVTAKTTAPLPEGSNLVRANDMVDFLLYKSAIVEKDTQKRVHRLLAEKLATAGKGEFINPDDQAKYEKKFPEAASKEKPKRGRPAKTASEE